MVRKAKKVIRQKQKQTQKQTVNVTINNDVKKRRKAFGPAGAGRSAGTVRKPQNNRMSYNVPAPPIIIQPPIQPIQQQIPIQLPIQQPIQQQSSIDISSNPLLSQMSEMNKTIASLYEKKFIKETKPIEKSTRKGTFHDDNTDVQDLTNEDVTQLVYPKMQRTKTLEDERTIRSLSGAFVTGSNTFTPFKSRKNEEFSNSNNETPKKTPSTPAPSQQFLINDWKPLIYARVNEAKGSTGYNNEQRNILLQDLIRVENDAMTIYNQMTTENKKLNKLEYDKLKTYIRGKKFQWKNYGKAKESKDVR